MGMDSNLPEYKLFGNTTTAAIRRLKSPVLVVPNGVPFKAIKKILYASEYTYLSPDNHLDLLKEFTRKFEAELQIFHVEIKAKEQVPVDVSDHTTAIDAVMENVDHTYRFIENSSIGNGIMKGVEAWQADLLVMVPHKTGFWESLLKGSATREMTLKTRVPLLVLPNTN
jgi:nucleotide-binding universal stress UspA family protein